MTIMITIFGNVSSGKSPWLRRIEQLATNRGYTVITHDYFLHSFMRNYPKALISAKEDIKKKNPDIGIIAVNTGMDQSPFRIEIDDFIGPLTVLDILTNGELHNKKGPEGP
ncbi:MAG: hypothetical protein ACXWT4_06050 [Methylobacter sp.]